jgi:hypothetical protein
MALDGYSKALGELYKNGYQNVFGQFRDEIGSFRGKKLGPQMAPFCGHFPR